VQPAEGAASQPTRIGSKGAARSQMITEIVRLRAIDAAQAVETLRPLVSKEGAITANKSGNSLVIVDYADNMARIRALVAQIDATTPPPRRSCWNTPARARSRRR
jgi:general secretion pathway protein D